MMLRSSCWGYWRICSHTPKRMSVFFRSIVDGIRTSSVPLQWPEAGANLFGKQLRLFPGRKVPALGELVVMHQLGICPLCPAPRSRIELIRENTTATGMETPFTLKYPPLPQYSQ